jgi:adenylylsulfate kinase
LSAYSGRFVVVPLPNNTHVFYGPDVGNLVVENDPFDDIIEAISATQLRRLGAEP